MYSLGCPRIKSRRPGPRTWKPAFHTLKPKLDMIRYSNIGQHSNTKVSQDINELCYRHIRYFKRDVNDRTKMSFSFFSSTL